MLDNTGKDKISDGVEFIKVNMDEYVRPNGLIEFLETGQIGGLGQETGEEKPGFWREFVSYAVIVAVALFIAVMLHQFVVINANIPSTSMVPTLNVKDRLIGFKLAYLFSEPERGDVIIFKHATSDTAESELLVKRVIGLPGDVIRIGSDGVRVNGEFLQENYLNEPMNVLSESEFVVPADSYFVMGDNRNVSYDSRMWKNTYVTKDEIIALALFKYYPKPKIIE